MPKGSKGQKPPPSSPNPPAKTIQSWDNEGGVPSMGDRSRKKGKDEKPFFGDFIEHPGSVGEMHFPYENRKKRPRDTNPLVQSHGFDWREWFVPPIVIPALYVAWLLGYALYLYLI